MRRDEARAAAFPASDQAHEIVQVVSGEYSATPGDLFAGRAETGRFGKHALRSRGSVRSSTEVIVGQKWEVLKP
jgi:hypothetical protein